MLPSLSTEMLMFSGFVCVGTFVSFGSSTCTVLVTTGMVMRKMINSTSMTSTSGVVLMEELKSSSSPSEDPTFIAMVGHPLLAVVGLRLDVAATEQNVV